MRAGTSPALARAMHNLIGLRTLTLSMVLSVGCRSDPSGARGEDDEQVAAGSHGHEATDPERHEADASDHGEGDPTSVDAHVFVWTTARSGVVAVPSPTVPAWKAANTTRPVK